MGMTWTWSHWCEQTKRKMEERRERIEAGRQQGGGAQWKIISRKKINNINILITQCVGCRGRRAVVVVVGLQKRRTACLRANRAAIGTNTTGQSCTHWRDRLWQPPSSRGKKPPAALTTTRLFMAGFAGFTLGLCHPSVRHPRVNRTSDRGSVLFPAAVHLCFYCRPCLPPFFSLHLCTVQTGESTVFFSIEKIPMADHQHKTR